MKPLIIAIGGPSGAGKTALALELARRLEGRCSRLALDWYYQPQPHLDLEQRALRNYDHPDALDWALVEAHLSALAEGRDIEAPVYLFDRHTRAEETRRLGASAVVIVEGILALHHEGVRARAALRAYVATREEECLRRRMERDIAERGRTEESVLRQYHATVRPMAEQYVVPSCRFADVVVSGDGPIGVGVEEILRRIG